MATKPQRHKAPRRDDRGSARQRGYTKAWERFRRSFLMRNPLCEYCLADGRTTAATVCDHDLPHDHDPSLFWDNTFTALCASHHSGEKQRAEAQLTGDDLLAWVQQRKTPRKVWGFSIPHGLQPSAVPVTIVCGPPASGKSTWARQRAKPGDLVIDFDVIRIAVGGTRWDERPQIVAAAFARRAQMLHSLAERQDGRCWFIVTAPTQQERDRWCEALGERSSVVVMDTPEAECVARIMRDPNRKPVASRQVEAVAEWWAEAQGDGRQAPDRGGGSILTGFQHGTSVDQ